MIQFRIASPSRFLIPIAALLLPGLLDGCAQTVPTRSDAESSAASVIREDTAFPLGKEIARVEVDNPYGEINVRDHDQAEVGVHAVIQVMPKKFAKPRLISTRDQGVLRLRVELPDGATDARYDMAVYVSKEMALILRGSSYRVDARKRSAALAVTTTTGKINASSRSALDLSTDSGTIQAAQLEANWSGSSRIRSESGLIVALAPLSGNITLSAETGGRLSTNFGLSVHTRANGGNQARAQYGAGTSEWRIESGSGEIVLEQAVLLGEDVGSSEDSD